MISICEPRFILFVHVGAWGICYGQIIYFNPARQKIQVLLHVYKLLQCRTEI